MDINSLLSFTVGQRYSLGESNSDPFKRTKLSLSVRRQILERLAGVLTVFGGRGKYKRSGVKEDMFGISTELVYDISDNVLANVSYSFSLVDSNLQTNEYTKNVVSTGIRMKF